LKTQPTDLKEELRAARQQRDQARAERDALAIQVSILTNERDDARARANQ
jgi:uncharacterized coiled-coil DUF342 family protein